MVVGCNNDDVDVEEDVWPESNVWGLKDCFYGAKIYKWARYQSSERKRERESKEKLCAIWVCERKDVLIYKSENYKLFNKRTWKLCVCMWKMARWEKFKFKFSIDVTQGIGFG